MGFFIFVLVGRALGLLTPIKPKIVLLLKLKTIFYHTKQNAVFFCVHDVTWVVKIAAYENSISVKPC